MVQDFLKKNMGIIGSIGQSFFYIQAFRVFWHHEARGLSLPGFILALSVLSCWMAYGVIVSDKNISISNAVGVIGAILVIIGIILYGC